MARSFSSALKLGTVYRDKITGVEGTCTSVLFSISGCVQGCLEFASGGKGDSTWFDEDRLVAAPEVKARRGGPMRTPPPTGGT